MIGASKASTVWRQVATGDRGLRALRSHPLPSGGSDASRASTVWRQVATANGGYGLRSHPLPSGGAARVKPPPSGDRWLRANRWLHT